MLPDIHGDFRLAVRSLRRQPGFSVLVVATLALGVGASTVVFGLANQVLLSPLPGVRDAGGAAYLEMRSREEPNTPMGFSPVDFLYVREAATSVEGIAAYGPARLTASTGESRPLSVWGSIIHGDFFEVLGTRAVRGRLLRAEETSFDAEPLVAVISERLWTTLWGRAEDVVGQTLLTNGQPVTVIGVAGGGFSGAERFQDADIWLPYSSLVPVMGSSPERLLSRQNVNHQRFVLRPRPEFSWTTVRAQLEQILANMASDNEENGPYLASLRPHLFEGLQVAPPNREPTYRALRTLSVVVGILLLMACANAANLLLFRGLLRRGEVAVRRALGASRARVARQELSESLVLAGFGSIVGLGIGWGIGYLFRGHRLLFRAEEFQGLTFDLRVLAFGGVVALGTTLLFGILPAAVAGRVAMGESLRDVARQQTRRRARLRHLLAAFQVALCVPLLVSALLLTRTLNNLYATDLGFSPEQLVTVTLSASGASPEAHGRLLEELEGLPSVDAAALDYSPVFTGGFMGRARLSEDPPDSHLMVPMNFVTPGWFELLGIAPTRGRTLRVEDEGAGGIPSAVVTEGLAHRLFGQTDVVGRILIAGGSPNPGPAEIVGVVADLRMDGPLFEPRGMIFFPYSERLTFFPQVSVLLRVRRFDGATIREVQEAFASVLPDFPNPETALLTDRIHRQLAEQRLFASLLSLVGGLALALVTVGLYGVIAFAVASRRREIGIRIALGAAVGSLARLVFGQAGAIVAPGILLGLTGAYVLSRFLEGRLYGVTPTDPPSYFAPAILLTAVVFVACWTPLVAAIRVDPAETLREE